METKRLQLVQKLKNYVVYVVSRPALAKIERLQNRFKRYAKYMPINRAKKLGQQYINHYNTWKKNKNYFGIRILHLYYFASSRDIYQKARKDKKFIKAVKTLDNAIDLLKKSRPRKVEPKIKNELNTKLLLKLANYIIYLSKSKEASNERRAQNLFKKSSEKMTDSKAKGLQLGYIALYKKWKNENNYLGLRMLSLFHHIANSKSMEKIKSSLSKVDRVMGILMTKYPLKGSEAKKKQETKIKKIKTGEKLKISLPGMQNTPRLRTKLREAYNVHFEKLKSTILGRLSEGKKTDAKISKIFSNLTACKDWKCLKQINETLQGKDYKGIKVKLGDEKLDLYIDSRKIDFLREFDLLLSADAGKMKEKEIQEYEQKLYKKLGEVLETAIERTFELQRSLR